MAKIKLKKTKLTKTHAPKLEKKFKRKKKKSKPNDPQLSDSDSDTDPQTKIQTLLDPFSKDQLVTLATDLSLSHDSLFNLLKSTADNDVSHRKVFVHGLGWEATRGLMDPIFGAFGEIEDLNVVISRATGKCKGYAFITYKTRKSAKKLLKNTKVQVGNRVVSCRLAAAGPAAPATAGIVSQQHFPSSDYHQRKIYVTNVFANTSVERLRGFFEKFGEIESGPTGLDPVTGKFKGYAIFVYKTVEGAKKVLEEPYRVFEGTRLHCQKASEDKSKVAGGAASITTALLPMQPQMMAAMAAAQQAQNMVLVGQQAGLVNPLYGGGMIPNANFGALMGGYYGMMGGQMQGMGLGAYGVPGTAPVGGDGSSGSSMLQGMQYLYPNMQSGQASSSPLPKALGTSGGGYFSGL